MDKRSPTSIDYTAFLEGSLVLDQDGNWFHEGSPFSNQRLSALFSQSVVWDENQKVYVIRLGRQQARFTYRDTPFFVLSLIDDATTWSVLLSDGCSYPLRPETLSTGESGQFYCRVVRTDDREVKARFTRPAHQALLNHVHDDASLTINGVVYPIPREQDLREILPAG